MEYSEEQIANTADIAKLYHEIKVTEEGLSATDIQGPNGTVREEEARGKLKGLLDSYRQIPPEIRNQLDIDIGKLEKLIS